MDDTITNLDLVLDNGELVRVEIPTKYFDDVIDSIDHALKRGDRWSVMSYDGCSANYLGHRLDQIVMSRVVAML